MKRLIRIAVYMAIGLWATFALWATLIMRAVARYCGAGTDAQFGPTTLQFITFVSILFSLALMGFSGGFYVIPNLIAPWWKANILPVIKDAFVKDEKPTESQPKPADWR